MFIVGVQVFYKFFVRFVNWAVDNMLMLKNFPRNFHEERIQQLTVWTVWCVIILLLCVLTVGCNVRDNHPPPPPPPTSTWPYLRCDICLEDGEY